MLDILSFCTHTMERFSKDLTKSLLPDSKAKEITLKNSVHHRSHKTFCKSLDLQKKDIVINFQKASHDFKKRLTRHAQDSLSIEEIKDLRSYVKDHRDEQEFCDSFRSTKRRSSSVSSIFSSLSSSSTTVSNKMKSLKFGSFHSRGGVRLMKDDKGAKQITEQLITIQQQPDTYRNSEDTSCISEIDDSKYDNNNNFTEGKLEEEKKQTTMDSMEYAGAEIYAFGENIQNMSQSKMNCKTNFTDPRNDCSRNPQEMMHRNNKQSTAANQISKLSPIPQEIDDEGQEGQKFQQADLSLELATSNSKEIRSISKFEAERAQMTAKKNYGIRRSCSLGKGTSKNEKGHKSAVSLKRNKSFEVPLRRGSTNAIGFSTKNTNAMRRKSMDLPGFINKESALGSLGKLNKKDSNISTLNLSGKDNLSEFDGDQSERQESESSQNRQSKLKVYSEEPFYIRRKKPLTKRISWQSIEIPAETLKKLQDRPSESGEREENTINNTELETPLRDLLPPVLLPSIYTQQNSLEKRQKSKHQTTKSSDHEQLSYKLEDCRYLRKPIPR